MIDLKSLEALGIDTAEGMTYCADDPEFYEEMLSEYISEAQTGAAELEQAYMSRDRSSYGIRAHTIKSTSRMIGAKYISEQARQLEMAAKEGNDETIVSLHDEFIKAYRELVEGICSSMD
jgi:HPt (histidine-containing phosphotransfer) domain-containing protein